MTPLAVDLTLGLLTASIVAVVLIRLDVGGHVRIVRRLNKNLD
jgi:hypothetical protein